MYDENVTSLDNVLHNLGNITGDFNDLLDTLYGILDSFQNDNGPISSAASTSPKNMNRDDRVNALRNFADHLIDGRDKKHYLDISTSGGAVRVYCTPANRTAIASILRRTADHIMVG